MIDPLRKELVRNPGREEFKRTMKINEFSSEELVDELLLS
jgi:hypothetical protein